MKSCLKRKHFEEEEQVHLQRAVDENLEALRDGASDATRRRLIQTYHIEKNARQQDQRKTKVVRFVPFEKGSPLLEKTKSIRPNGVFEILDLEYDFELDCLVICNEN